MLSGSWTLRDTKCIYGCLEMTMPRGPKGRKYPRDTNQLAKLMVDILTGEVADREPTPEEHGKNPAAVTAGRKGGLKGGKVLQHH